MLGSKVLLSAQSVLDCVLLDDHSDVGTALCHQKTAEIFIRCLIDNKLVKQGPLEEELLGAANACCFFRDERNLNSPSRKVLGLAGLVISVKSLDPYQIEDFVTKRATSTSAQSPGS